MHPTQQAPLETPLRFVNGFASLPHGFHTRLQAEGLPEPYLVGVSDDAATLLGLDPALIRSAAWIDAFAGNRRLAGADPLAAVYSGHQFGVWAGQLGDGRALLLGEIERPDGTRWEIQLKGAGRTPYSRMGDGRAVLRSSIREFLCSEAMHHLGIPTSRALAVVGSDLPVMRETIETAAVTTRLAPSFVRFGSFEHFYSRQRHDELRQLADHVIERHYPELADRPDRYAAFLAEVTARTARLVAQWQSVGFCHGVLNTDNMSILGLTIDYGPFGFMDGFDADHVCNHSDHAGRYAYSMQPDIGEWNCYCLGQALVPLIGSVDATKDALSGYRAEFARELDRRLHAKLGLSDVRDADSALFDRMFAIMDANRVDFTLFFRRLAQVRAGDAAGDVGCRDLFIDRAAFDAWARDYRARLSGEARADADRAAAMNRTNPKFVLRNHLAEQAIRQARGNHEAQRMGIAQASPSSSDADGPDYSEVVRLLEVLRRPFDEQPEHEAYAGLPPEWSQGLSVSCSS